MITQRSRFRVLACCFAIASMISLIAGLVTGDARALQSTTFVSPLAPLDTLTPRAWLPLVMKNHQTMKSRSGIHLGNRTSDWPGVLFQRIEYKTDGSGIWPAAVIVLSDQVYDIPRISDSGSPDYCRVKWWQAAGIKRPDVFDYLKRAAQAGTKVIIRIYPSPGNFYDYNVAGWPNHHLSSGGPVGSRYLCNHELYTQNEIGKFATYRSPGDLVDEMASIHRANQAAGWTEYGFEPANEPNLEWYHPPNFTWGTRLDDPNIWVEMDNYFVAVYDYHTRNPQLGDFRLLAPPMDQEWYSIGIDLSVCENRRLTNGLIGYDYMAGTYFYYFDGYDWHNYWKYGNERYTSCGQGGNIVSYYFPYWMKDAISQKGGNISEADLASPWQMRGTNPLSSKRGSDADEAVDSLGQFIATESNATRIIVWLLNDDTGCCDGEHDWHEAYNDSSSYYEWLWFRWWWLNPENSP